MAEKAGVQSADSLRALDRVKLDVENGNTGVPSPERVEHQKHVVLHVDAQGPKHQAEEIHDLLANCIRPLTTTFVGQSWQPIDGEPVLLGPVDGEVLELGVLGELGGAFR